VWKTEGKRLLGNLMLRQECVKMGLEEVGSGGMEWIVVTQYRDRWRAVVNAVMNLRVSIKSGIFLIRGPVCFLGMMVLHGVS
jgi:hypothetical protein